MSSRSNTAAQGINRRVFFRLPMRLDIRFRWVTSAGPGEWQPGAVEDLSAGGMRMVSAHLDSMDDVLVLNGDVRLQVEFALEGFAPDSEPQLRVPAKVAWLERGDDGQRRAGVQFDGLSQDRQAALDSFVLNSCRPPVPKAP